jgi:hypothetical protein
VSKPGAEKPLYPPSLDAANPAGGKPPARAILQPWDCIHFADDWNAGNQLWRFGNEKCL